MSRHDAIGILYARSKCGMLLTEADVALAVMFILAPAMLDKSTHTFTSDALMDLVTAPV